MAMAASIAATAQIKVTTPQGDLKFRLIGRTSLDLGTYLGTEGKANRNGASVNDTRLGFVADMDTTWQAKVEICFTGGKISFRDVYVQRQFCGGHRTLTIGNQFMPFGLKPAGLAYKFIETSASDYTFTSSRKLGAMYGVNRAKYNFSAGLFYDGNIDSKGTNEGWDLAAQFIARPVDHDGTILHFGVSPIFTHPRSTVSYNAFVPTTVNSNKRIATGEMGAYNYGRFEAQALYILRRFYVEARYQMVAVNRPNEVKMAEDVTVTQDNYSAHGIMCQASFLLLGKQQNYNRKTALAANPDAKSLEILARYCQTDLDDYGTVNDITVGLNYYFNKYLRTKINYVHSTIKDGDGINMLEGRMQFSF